MKYEHIGFEKEEIRQGMERTGLKTPEEVLERWARSQYPIDSGVYYIKKIGKTFIEIGEYD